MKINISYRIKEGYYSCCYRIYRN